MKDRRMSREQNTDRAGTCLEVSVIVSAGGMGEMQGCQVGVDRRGI